MVEREVVVEVMIPQAGKARNEEKGEEFSLAHGRQVS
jgi:hypothetical protein